MGSIIGYKKKVLYDQLGKYKLTILKHRLFVIGLIIKLVAPFFFIGDLLKNKFIPFVNYFSSTGFSNPYEHFFNLEKFDFFPYPALMLYIQSTYSFFFQDSIVLQSFLFRVPLLLADITVLVVLSRFLKKADNKLLLLYWCSPVLFYINYLHGQFDVLPIMFLFVSFFFLFKKKFIMASVLLGLGLATKTNLLIALPFFFIYLWKFNNPNRKIQSVSIAFFLVFGAFFLLNINYLFDEEFITLVFKNKEQIKLLDFKIGFGKLFFYVVPAIYVLLLAKVIRYKQLSKDLFMMFIGFAFCSLLLFIPPKPGWYFWIIPFLIYFYIKESKLSIFPLLALQIFYLIYFAIIPDSDFANLYILSKDNTSLYTVLEYYDLNADMLINIVFTGLQVLLFINIFWIYRIGITKNVKAKIKNAPCLIGIGGDSGVGKSTLTASIQNLFAKDNMTILRGDDMHKWERGHAMWETHTHLSPKANNLHEEINQLKALKEGKKILRRHYDHNTGTFTKPLTIYPNKVILFEGLHPFYILAKRELFDIKIFVSPTEDLRLHWKINRDMKKRGYSKEEVISQLEFRREDSVKYIQSQSQHADIKISYYPVNNNFEVGNGEEVDIGLMISCDTSIDLNFFCEKFNSINAIQVKHFYDTDSQRLEVEGKITLSEVEKTAYVIVDNAEDFIEDPIWEDNYKGFLQTFLLYYIKKKISN
ncbi:hypothetical protein [Flavivirga eckloniae]|uniref:Phosphoribulokinase n=1 Tax=Flavivirga eckloniae TaxID=1803846 RepID=A0A2K9PQN8_9FLAO|nr:hypothetical protein [Flavivirga eckloniae]AUP79382.1 hypothetical protein C1H87_11950 [Flavivirga eckloniae]